MFEFTLSKTTLLTPMMTVASAVDKKQVLPILSNILIYLKDNQLRLTATDLEIEITAVVTCASSKGEGEVTVPAKKFVDIVRSLDEDATPAIRFATDSAVLKAGRSQFKLATLAASQYPVRENECNEIELNLPRLRFMELLQATHFAIAQQEVRLFLNGLLFELEGRHITTVGTDGHRMAVCKLELDLPPQMHHRFLIPRKGVQEMLKLLNNIDDETVQISGGKRHFKLSTSSYSLQCRLIEARFPLYSRAIPNVQDKSVIIEREVLKRALSRMMILAHEKSRAVVLHLQDNTLILIANNQEQEEAMESLEARTEGGEIKIAINASYLLDVLHYLKEGLVRLSMSTTDSSLLVESADWSHYQYIIMPMKL